MPGVPGGCQGVALWEIDAPPPEASSISIGPRAGVHLSPIGGPQIINPYHIAQIGFLAMPFLSSASEGPAILHLGHYICNRPYVAVHTHEKC